MIPFFHSAMNPEQGHHMLTRSQARIQRLVDAAEERVPRIVSVRYKVSVELGTEEQRFWDYYPKHKVEGIIATDEYGNEYVWTRQPTYPYLIKED